MAIVQTPQYWKKNIAIIGMVAILAACGGGGGNSSSDSGSGSSSGNGSGSVTPPPVELDVTPDNFVFEAKNDAMPGETYTSNTITVSGINAAVPVSITGGEYAIDKGNFTAAATTVSAGQTIVIKATAAPTLDSIVDVVLTIGGVKGTYSIITPVDETAPTAEFMFPPPVSMTDGANVLVRGVASDDYSKITAVTVNDIPVESDDNFATWHLRVDLNLDEDNPLVVKTTDAVGNTSTNAAKVIVHRGAITEPFPDAENEFVGVVDFVIDRLDGRDRLITVGGNTSEVISVDLLTGERTPFIIPNPFDSSLSSIWGIALDAQAKELYFRDHSTMLAQPLDGGMPRMNSDIKLYGGQICAIDDLDEEVRIVLVNIGNGDIFVTDSTLTEFNILSSVSKGIPDTEHPIGESYGVALDKSRGRYLVTDDNQRIVAVDRITGKRDYFSSNSIGTGDNFGDVGSAYLDGIAIDETNSRALVSEYATKGRLFSIDLTTGNRKLLSDSSEPDTGVAVSKLYGIKINTPFSYAFVADNELKAVIAIDLVTGHRVVFSKSTTTP